MDLAHEMFRLPNNSDAAFEKHTCIRKPSPMLLHPDYGIAAVKWWGRGNHPPGLGIRIDLRLEPDYLLAS